MAEITKEFLEEALGEQVLSFSVTPRSSIGDCHYILKFGLQVKLKRTPSVLQHYVLKYCPSDSEQEELKTGNEAFRKEYLIYHTFVPELYRFQRNTRNIYSNQGKHRKIKLPFNDLVFGRAAEYNISPPTGENGHGANLLENYIIMPDLCCRGFRRNPDPSTGFDLNHCKLVIEAQARFHALSWAHKQLNNVDRLSHRFPFLTGTLFDDMSDHVLIDTVKENLALFREAVKQEIPHELVKKSLIQSLNDFLDKSVDIVALYFSDTRELSEPDVNADNLLRLAQPTVEKEQPWLVATHGACTSNNFMFRYDEDTMKPVEVVLIDFQYTRESDPCVDLAYTIYTNTAATIRQANIDDLLQHYILTFIRICERFKVLPLAGFQLSELKRRFHRAKIFGFLMAVLSLPKFLIDAQTSTDGALTPTNRLRKDPAAIVANSSRFRQRAVDLVCELWQEGVI